MDDFNPTPGSNIDKLIDELENILDANKSSERNHSPFPTRESFLKVSMDGRVAIRVSEDKMSVFMDLYSPKGNGFLVGKEQVSFALSEAEINVTVDWEQIYNGIQRSQFEKHDVIGLVIARGTPAKPFIPSHWEMEDTLVAAGDIPVDETLAKIDLRAKSPFVLLEQGQVLAHFTEEVEGFDGRDVLGNNIKPAKVRTDPLEPGEGVTKTLEPGGEQYLRASRAGLLVRTKTMLKVEDVLVIPGDIDYHTGHIDFPGHIVVGGLVRDGFHVKSGKNILFHNTLDASLVECGGDLTCRGGILGRGKGKVIVQGILKAKFIENCIIESSQDVEITGSILHSQIKTQGNLLLGQKSLLVGSLVFCKGKLAVSQIGTPAGDSSEIHMGLDWRILEQLLDIRNKTMNLVQKKKKLELLAPTDPAEINSQSDLLLKIQAALSTLAQQARTASVALEENYQSKVEVHGMIFPGTCLEICHITHVLRTVKSHVSVNLNKDTGMLEFHPLQKTS